MKERISLWNHLCFEFRTYTSFFNIFIIVFFCLFLNDALGLFFLNFFFSFFSIEFGKMIFDVVHFNIRKKNSGNFTRNKWIIKWTKQKLHGRMDTHAHITHKMWERDSEKEMQNRKFNFVCVWSVYVNVVVVVLVCFLCLTLTLRLNECNPSIFFLIFCSTHISLTLFGMFVVILKKYYGAYEFNLYNYFHDFFSLCFKYTHLSSSSFSSSSYCVSCVSVDVQWMYSSVVSLESYCVCVWTCVCVCVVFLLFLIKATTFFWGMREMGGCLKAFRAVDGKINCPKNKVTVILRYNTRCTCALNKYIFIL